MDINSELIKLVNKYNPNPVKRTLTEDTNIETDLGIMGDDAFSLIVEYSKIFSVDISKFDIDNYFTAESDFLDYFFSKIFRKMKVPKQGLKISELQKGIELGKLE